MTSVAHIRQAIKKETTSIPVKREDPLADFGRTANANDTCYLRTCGGDGGLSSCVTLCSAKKGLLYGKRPVAGACHVLCAVAAEPCRRYLFHDGVDARSYGKARCVGVLCILRSSSVVLMCSVLFSGV